MQVSTKRVEPISEERALKLLQDIRQRLKGAGKPFKALDLEPASEDGVWRAQLTTPSNVEYLEGVYSLQELCHWAQNMGPIACLEENKKKP